MCAVDVSVDVACGGDVDVSGRSHDHGKSNFNFSSIETVILNVIYVVL